MVVDDKSRTRTLAQLMAVTRALNSIIPIEALIQRPIHTLKFRRNFRAISGAAFLGHGRISVVVSNGKCFGNQFPMAINLLVISDTA